MDTLSRTARTRAWEPQTRRESRVLQGSTHPAHTTAGLMPGAAQTRPPGAPARARAAPSTPAHAPEYRRRCAPAPGRPHLHSPPRKGPSLHDAKGGMQQVRHRPVAGCNTRARGGAGAPLPARVSCLAQILLCVCLHSRYAPRRCRPSGTALMLPLSREGGPLGRRRRAARHAQRRTGDRAAGRHTLTRRTRRRAGRKTV